MTTADTQISAADDDSFAATQFPADFQYGSPHFPQLWTDPCRQVTFLDDWIQPSDANRQICASAADEYHNTLFEEEGYQLLPVNAPNDAFTLDVEGQHQNMPAPAMDIQGATISENFNTVDQIDFDQHGLFQHDVFGAADEFFNCDTFEKTQSHATGRLCVDSGATLTIFDADMKKHLRNIRRSRASIQGFAGDARVRADSHGTAHMYIIHPTDQSLCEHLTLPGDVVNEASQGLLSAYDMCRGQGFTLVLDCGNSDVAGFYKFTSPLSYQDGRLQSGAVCKFIPVIFSPERRLWYIYYAIAGSPAEAKQAGLNFQKDVFHQTSTQDYVNHLNHSLVEGAAANHHFEQFPEQFYDECVTSHLPHYNTDSVYQRNVDASVQFWANELTGDLQDDHYDVFSAEAYDVHFSTMDRMQDELTNGDLEIEEVETPIPVDCTKVYMENDVVLSAGLRAQERKESIKSRHARLAHMGHCPGCAICQQVRGSLRSVMGSATPKGDPVEGRTWSWDSVYWSHPSRQGHNYTICGRDQKTGYCRNIHMTTRKHAAQLIIDEVKEMRADPELNNPLISTFALLDDAGEWGFENTEVQAAFKAAGIIICVRPTAADKRLMAHGEHTVSLTEQGQAKIMLANCLGIEDHEFASDHAVMMRNLIPMKKNAGPDGDGLRPLSAISGGRVTNRECEKRLFYSHTPGTLAIVQIPHYPKGSNVGELARCRWGRVIKMEKDVPVFEDMATRHRFRSKNFTVVALPPNMSAYEYVGLPVPALPTSCLPAMGRQSPDDLSLVVHLDQIVPPSTRPVRSIVEDIAGHGSGPTGHAIVTDANGTILERTDESSPWLEPTTSRIVIEQIPEIPEIQGVTESIEYQIQMLDYKPTHFIGRDVFKRFDGFPGVSRGIVTDTEPELGSNPMTHLWGIKFDDGHIMDFDSDDMKNYCIRKEHGTVDRPTNPLPDLVSDSDTDDEDDDGRPERYDGNTIWYHCEDNETFLDMCEKFRLTKTEDQKQYFRWCKSEFNRGNDKSFKTAENCIWFPSPFSANNSKQSGARYRFKAGTQFPRPEGEFWDKFVRGENDQVDHENVSAAISDIVSRARHETICEILVDWDHFKAAHSSDDPDDRILHQVHAADIADKTGISDVDWALMDDARYTDPATGMPIPPANAAKVLSDPNRELWDAAMKKEEDILDEMGVFEHDLTMTELRARDIVPRMSIVPLMMLLSIKLKPDGSFDKAKGRQVAAGHPGHMKKGIHYAVVFSASPQVAVGRILKAASVHSGMTPFVFDVRAAYLHAEAEEHMQIPVSYPKGRKRYKTINGVKTELFALVVKNLYGLPTAGRHWSKERDNFIKSCPLWTAVQMIYEPCMWKLIIDGRICFVNFHTDDCDGLCEDPRDAKTIHDAFDKKYGVSSVDVRYMLGVQRDTTVKDGVTYIHMSQSGYLDKVWAKFKHLRVGLNGTTMKVPSTPFPVGLFCSGVDPKTRKPIEISDAERDEAFAAGFMELCGSLLWAARNAYPGASFACGMLSKCMSKPSMVAMAAGAHCLHYLWHHKHDGIVFNSDGNREPICFYDSSHNQNGNTFKNQYGFVIYWMGGPVLWASKGHKHPGLSVAEDEYMTLTHAYRQAQWLRNLLDEMGFGYLIQNPLLCLGDNTQADLWARENIITDANKYITRDYCKISVAVKDRHIEPRHISTKLNLSDLFTKSVPKEVIDSLYDSMRGAGLFPAMPPTAYDLDDVRIINAAELISTRNSAAISEMSLMSAADRHDLFVRQNFEDGLTLPDDYYDDLEDDEGSIIL